MGPFVVVGLFFKTQYDSDLLDSKHMLEGLETSAASTADAAGQQPVIS